VCSAFEEVLTAVVRLRPKPESSGAVPPRRLQSKDDVKEFRKNIEHYLEQAHNEARALGYSEKSVLLAGFAVVAFVNELILNLRMEIFSEWVGNPLQHRFGAAKAGNTFFEYMEGLLAESPASSSVETDPARLADLLELYHLCVLLGFRGRYGTDPDDRLPRLLQKVDTRIREIRGAGHNRDLSPAWKLPEGETILLQQDRWARPLLITFGCCVVLALLLFIGFSISIRSGVASVTAAASEAGR
jgi:type VI secretion system protein ImpK